MRMLEKLAKRQRHPPSDNLRGAGSPSTGAEGQASSRSS
jgi:hypothetical protein